VGAKRMSYWAQSFWAESDQFHCDVVTATKQPENKKSVFFVADPGGSLIGKFLFGYSWIAPLKDFISRSEEYDVAIISGGPFGHFQIADFIRKNFRTKVVLDFRDPLAGNSRFKNGMLKEMVKSTFERSVLKNANFVTTVNEYCRKLLSKNTDPSKIVVIENGYDERTLDSVPSSGFDDNLVHIVYAGSFYEDRNPSIFLQRLVAQKNGRFIMHHVGSPSPFLKPFEGSPFIVQHGEKSYRETISIMKKCTTGLIITSGDAMESTTKIYDYIGCNLDIAVVTNGVPETGSINDVTSKVRNKTSWVKNNPESIDNFFDKYKINEESLQHRDQFSRQWGFKQLKALFS
jgi:glycosyltransferase involved in cell wall biosynthesis